MSPLSWHTEQRKISDLVPYEHNPRQITDKQVADLKKSITKFDFVEIPAINTDNTIIAGHQRIKIMQLIGRSEETIDVRVPSRLLDESEVKEYCVRSNRNTGEWDMDKLANAFDVEALKEWGFEDKDLGLDTKLEENEVPETFPDYLSFVVTAEQRKIIEDRLILENGETQTEKLISLCQNT